MPDVHLLATTCPDFCARRRAQPDRATSEGERAAALLRGSRVPLGTRATAYQARPLSMLRERGGRRERTPRFRSRHLVPGASGLLASLPTQRPIRMADAEAAELR